MRLFTTLHNYKKNYLAKDLIAGVVMAAVSIPIAMGYAEVSGLPAVMGCMVRYFRFFYLPAFRHRHSLSLAWDAARQQLLAPV